MAGNAGQHRQRISPPRLARYILGISVSRSDEAALIGDLEEEFFDRLQQSPRSADMWYWRQTALSAPYLIARRAQSVSPRHLLAALLVFGGLFFLLGYWDIWIARNAARSYAAISPPGDYSAPRTVYLIVQMLGIAIAGGVIALTLFHRHQHFMKNTLMYLTPAALILIAPSLINFMTPGEGYDQSFLLMRMGLSLPPLIAGATIAMAVRNNINNENKEAFSNFS